MTMRKTMTLAVALTLGASLAFAGPGAGKGEFGKGHARAEARFAEKLNLTEAQKAQMEELRNNFRASNQQRFATHRDTVRQYREARQAGDTAHADALKQTLELQRGELNQLRQAHHERVLSILTAEQRAQLEAMKAERGERKEKGSKGIKRQRGRV